MEELEGSIIRAYLLPELEDPEAPFTNVRVMKENNCATRKFPGPRCKIVLHVLVEMSTVYMEQVDGCIGEVR